MNLQIALIFEGFAEALTLAAKLGVDVEKLLPLIQASMVRSGVVDYKAPFILKRDFSPNFPLRLMLKDIRLALDAAKESRVRLPGLEAVEEVYDVAAEEGQEDLDYAATLTLLEKWAGVEVKGGGVERHCPKELTERRLIQIAEVSAHHVEMAAESRPHRHSVKQPLFIVASRHASIAARDIEHSFCFDLAAVSDRIPSRNCRGPFVGILSAIRSFPGMPRCFR